MHGDLHLSGRLEILATGKVFGENVLALAPKKEECLRASAIWQTDGRMMAVSIAKSKLALTTR